jgi:uncharacterized protein (UPF0254 family)
MVIFMGKTNKPRMNFTLGDEEKSFIDMWAEEEDRSVANLLERIVKDAIAKKKGVSTEKVGRSGKSGSGHKT